MISNKIMRRISTHIYIYDDDDDDDDIPKCKICKEKEVIYTLIFGLFN